MARHANRGNQTGWIGDALARDIEGGTVIRRRSNNRKTQGHVDALVEIKRFDGDQRLVDTDGALQVGRLG